MRLASGLEIEAMEGGEHGEFELEGVVRGDLEWDVSVVVIFGDFDAKDLLRCGLARCYEFLTGLLSLLHTVSFLIR
jgi:hypothetical protein